MGNFLVMEVGRDKCILRKWLMLRFSIIQARSFCLYVKQCKLKIKETFAYKFCDNNFLFSSCSFWTWLLESVRVNFRYPKCCNLGVTGAEFVGYRLLDDVSCFTDPCFAFCTVQLQSFLHCRQLLRSTTSFRCLFTVASAPSPGRCLICNQAQNVKSV